MPINILEGAINAATQIGQAGMGMLLGRMGEGHNDRRQLEQQRKLAEQQADIQLRAGQAMGDYNYRKQLEMWEATNYDAQRKQIEKAGLNPGLLYGMKGGGGVSTGSIAGMGAVSGGNAAVGGPEAQAGMGMALQAQMMQAQIKLMEAQAGKTEVETTKIAGVDTTQVQTQTESLTQGIENQKAAKIMMGVETQLKEIAAEVNGRSVEATIRYIDAHAGEMMRQEEIARFNANIAEDTWRTKVDIIRTELTGMIIRNAAMEAGIKLTEAQTKQIEHAIVQNWQRIEIDRTNSNTNERGQRTQADAIDWNQTYGLPQEMIKQLIPQINRMLDRTGGSSIHREDSKGNWSETYKRHW